MDTQDKTPVEILSKESYRQGPKNRRNRWRLLRNVLRAVALFKTHEAQEVEIGEVISQIKQIPTDKVYQLKRHRSRENSAYTIALKDLRREQSLIQCVERGNPDDLDQIKIEIEKDPYKLLRTSSHPFALINKRNRDGQTPLYIACKNGNLEVVKLLLDEGADYLISSLIEGEEESNLEVAIRWGHTTIVKILIKKNWPQEILKKAKKACTSPEILALLKSKDTKSRWLWFCCSSKKKN